MSGSGRLCDFRFRPIPEVHKIQLVLHIWTMAKPTGHQRFYLFQIAYMRWFGALFAAAALFITAHNIPWLLRSNDRGLLLTNLAAGLAFLVIGVILYRIGTVVQRRYRAHIDRQIE